ncbi:hypothetical protein [Chelatococcus reniformis]|uniref:DUF4148 domain-containing protein n=1 Tax=Chelatococcus reniformis TaxID=1494448 RepID=A0A916UFR5_9HYPH|nr:hypothetical protein [Chelatococcus reniformis]GGC71496.1 hypothetical protein GCM10010994_32510 [Chelatococcus reniformis]
MAAAAAAAALLAMGGCAAELGTSVKGVAKATGFATDSPKSTEFVAASRPARIDYMPVGIAQPARPTPPKSAAEVQALQKNLEDTRTANTEAGRSAQAAGQTPAPTPAVAPRDHVAPSATD